MKSLIMVVAALLLQYGFANAQSSDAANAGKTIRLGGVSVGTIESVVIDKNDQGPRFTISVRMKFPDFATNLDKILSARGNLGKCQQRFFWRGDTSMHGGGKTLNMTSRVAYEAWLCIKHIDNLRIAGDARNVDWTLFVQPAPLDQLYVSARVNDIRGWPNWIEAAFGVRITENVELALPTSCGTCSCMDVVKSVLPRLDDSEFTVEKDGTLLVAATLSVDNNVLTKVLACTP